jgi:hypothetical protein
MKRVQETERKGFRDTVRVAAFLKNKQPKPFAAFLCIAWISVRRCVNSSLVPDL